MAKFANRVKETTATTGTGTLDLAGAATGFRAFSDELTSGDEVYYLIVDDPDSPTAYEYGIGTFTSGSPDTLSRDTVEGSSNSDAKVSFAAGSKTVVATPTAVGLGTNGNVTGSFTPGLTFDTAGDLSVAYSVQVGAYTRLGDIVIARFRIQTSTFTHGSASGNLRITGLPVTIANNTEQPVGSVVMEGWTNANVKSLSCVGVVNTTYMNVYGSASGASIIVFDEGDMPTGGTVIVYGTITYGV